ncbi:MAG: class I SAM-dependent methyltransferase [Myxococcota bacterium]
MDQPSAVRQVFGAAAEKYAHSSVHAGGPDLEAMLAAAAIRGHERLLDVGCGAGHTALAFAAAGADVEALDLTGEMLIQGRRMAEERGLSNVRFRQGDVARVPFAEASFDVVTSRLSAHHYARPELALAEVARVLRPGGHFLLADSVAPEDPALDTFFNAVELLRDRSHARNHTAPQWCAMFEAAGLRASLQGSFAFRIGFDGWVDRVSTPAAETALLRSLFAGASDEAKAFFRIASDLSFDIPVALIRGQRRSQIS